jgi:CutC family
MSILPSRLRRDAVEAIEALARPGIAPALISGQHDNAMDGKETPARLVGAAPNRLKIVAYGGFNAANIAAVLRRSGAGAKVPKIFVDNEGGGRMATRHLIAQGHRRIGSFPVRRV